MSNNYKEQLNLGLLHNSTTIMVSEKIIFEISVNMSCSHFEFSNELKIINLHLKPIQVTRFKVMTISYMEQEQDLKWWQYLTWNKNKISSDDNILHGTRTRIKWWQYLTWNEEQDLKWSQYLTWNKNKI